MISTFYFPNRWRRNLIWSLGEGDKLWQVQSWAHGMRALLKLMKMMTMMQMVMIVLMTILIMHLRYANLYVFVDESFMSTMPQMSGVSSSELRMFFGWVRSFVACFLGKWNLEVFMTRLASNEIHEWPKIRVYSVSSQLYLMPTWEEFQRVIKDALVDILEKDVNKLIQCLWGIVISRTKLNSEAQHFVNTLWGIVE